jgi:hypothetical protein
VPFLTVLRVRSPLPCILALAALAGLLAGCSKDKPTKSHDTTPEWFDLSSPIGTIGTLNMAYEQRDSVSYAKLFDDDFVFRFSPIDLDSRSDMQPQWDLPDELAAAFAMFRDQRVDKITLSFQFSPAVPSDSVAPGSYKVQVDQLHLSVFTERDGIPWELRVNGSDGDLYLRPSVGNDGEQRWRILRWEDEPVPGKDLRRSPGGLVLEATWGEIKWLYAPGDQTPPAAIRSLRAASVTESAIALAWEAVGDDSLHGCARKYNLRYSEAEIDDGSWAGATRVLVPSLPQPAGSTETFTVQGLEPDHTYHFALRAVDERGLTSALSNPVSATTAASPSTALQQFLFLRNP